MRTRFIILFLLFTIFATSSGNVLNGFIQRMLGGEESQQRGFSESITRILDYLYPKDDADSRIMKEIFSLLADDGPPSLEGGIDALDYLVDRK
ncbi:unnamed protein product [Colias eurytheme]|nr:unnamed protein product [Colias eurytheme]